MIEYKPYINITKKFINLDFKNIIEKNLIEEYLNIFKYKHTFFNILNFFKKNEIYDNSDEIIDDETYEILGLSLMNHRISSLKIVKIPFYRNYIINEYDGAESILL